MNQSRADREKEIDELHYEYQQKIREARENPELEQLKDENRGMRQDYEQLEREFENYRSEAA